jgi:predicted NACHT family NTPase
MVRKATNLKEAYDNLTVTPLKTEEEFQIFHVKRKDSPIADIKKRIEIGRHEKYLFTGLRGSGKSTELNGLVSSLDKDQYFPINYSILENLAPEDFDYKEFFVHLD